MSEIQIDCLNLASVKQRYGTLKSLEEKHDFIRRVKATLDNTPWARVSPIWLQIYSQRPELAPPLTPIQAAALEAHAFLDQQIDFTLLDLEKVIAAEHAQQALEEPAEIEEPEEERDDPEYSAAQSCLAIHYLLDAARHTRRDKAFERFIVALTGWKEDTVQRAHAKMDARKKQTARDLRILKAYFEELGLQKVVEQIETHLADAENCEDEDFFLNF
jgi:hypothetical protein